MNEMLHLRLILGQGRDHLESRKGFVRVECMRFGEIEKPR